MSAEAASALDEAWDTLQSHWGDDERHKRFVQLAATLEALPDAAKRYKLAKDDPSRAEKAAVGLDLVLKAALARMTPVARDPSAKAPVAWWMPLGTLVALFLATPMAAQALHRPKLLSPSTFAVEVLVVALIPWGRLRREE